MYVCMYTYIHKYIPSLGEMEVEDSEAEGPNTNGITVTGFGKVKVVTAASRAANEQGVTILLSAPALHREAPQRKLPQAGFQMVGDGGAQAGGRGAVTGALFCLAAKSSCLNLILYLHESRCSNQVFLLFDCWHCHRPSPIISPIISIPHFIPHLPHFFRARRLT